MLSFICPHCGEESTEIGLSCTGANLYHFDLEEEESNFEEFVEDGKQKYYCIQCGVFVGQKKLEQQGLYMEGKI